MISVSMYTICADARHSAYGIAGQFVFVLMISALIVSYLMILNIPCAVR